MAENNVRSNGEPHGRNDADLHYEDTEAPQNPPNSLLKPNVRREWLASSLGIVVMLFLAVAAALVWVMVERRLGGGPLHTSDPQETVGTTGERFLDPSPGGFNPVPRPRSTEDELKFRGGSGIRNLNDLQYAAEGSRVSLEGVIVERADGGAFMIRQGDTTALVITAGGTPTVRSGQRVNVNGIVEGMGPGMRIRASRIDVR
ncbi:MAG TPA: hypothetical protein VM846_11275 [Vicinamibacterales bacterium]|nr:hypothetical protein [Vicinamibacterales bacterium]